MKTIQKIMCSFGWHYWLYKDPLMGSYSFSNSKKTNRRECIFCEKKQHRELNNWFNL